MSTTQNAVLTLGYVSFTAPAGSVCDYWKAHGKKMADWVATWRVWMRRAPEFAGRNRNTRFVAAVEMPFERGQRTPGPPVQIREHPLFRGIKGLKN